MSSSSLSNSYLQRWSGEWEAEWVRTAAASRGKLAVCLPLGLLVAVEARGTPSGGVSVGAKEISPQAAVSLSGHMGEVSEYSAHSLFFLKAWRRFPILTLRHSDVSGTGPKGT